MYLEAYGHAGLKIGPDVLADITRSRMEIVGGRKSALIGQAQLTAARNGRPPIMISAYGHLGKKASVMMQEIAARIDRHNITGRKEEAMTVTNNFIYQLSGPGSRVVQGDDNSTNVITINEHDLFDQLAAVVRANVGEAALLQEILEQLNELKAEKNRTSYLEKAAKFVTAAASIARVLTPYLPAIFEMARKLNP